ncbi:lasso peptide biosynthesis PqqD family chaperone [Actinoplanes sp. RD1]|uniref:lasso peptide biosynthesis PqqD family chaperone n=1 Tax=Actinoplanes sp. RD1 TaxID=3064538 RepID=UPI0027403322|nr:lasso peptide biosynthesis PqqD family chaperone [Actinoplanes sp. RD1]
MPITLRAEVTFTPTEYGAVLLDLRTGRYWQLSRTAAVIVAAVRAGRGRDGALDDLRVRFDVGDDRLVRDVDTLLEQLRAGGLAVC